MQPMRLNNPQEVYLRQSIMTASPIELIVIIYDNLRKSLVLGQKAIKNKKTEVAHKHLMKAQDIVAELIGSLDMNQEISEELLSLYEFILNSVEQANIDKDKQALTPVIEIVEELRQTWKEISKTQTGTMALSDK